MKLMPFSVEGLFTNLTLLGKVMVKLIVEAFCLKLGYAGNVALKENCSASFGDEVIRFEKTNTTVNS